MRSRVLVLLSVALAMVVSLALAQGKKPLTNDDVLQMVKVGFQESMIIKAIEANDTNFDVSFQPLMDLKNAGMSQAVIEAMLAAEAKKKAPAPAANTPKDLSSSGQKSVAGDPPGLPEEVGVYVVKSPGVLAAMEPEIVTWRTGGILKAMATGGLTKGHVNGVVKNKHGSLQLAPPLEFVIRCPEGVSANEYQLLRLDEHGDRREFRAITGGILHASGGAERNAVPADAEKVAPRTYKIKIAQLKKGEYGFLPPGAYGSASTASVGKIYTFWIVE